jgi:predicted nuclease with TOPRIM domain
MTSHLRKIVSDDRGNPHRPRARSELVYCDIGLTRQELKTKLKPEICGAGSMALDNIEQLEAKINRLIEKHERVKKEKESVEKRLQQRESEWHHLKGQIRQYERERVEFREKLDKILGQFASLDLPD